MAKIREKDRTSVMNAIAGGVTPRQGIQHIQVGRLQETDALLKDIKAISEGHGAVRIINASYGSGKTFFLTLTKTVALKNNMLTASADFSPDRRLYASDGKANALYQELIRQLSSSRHPDGGALEELLESLDDKVSLGDSEFLSSIRKLPYGYDAVSVIGAWHIASHPQTEKEKRDSFRLKDACLRWFAGENTVEHKKMLGVKSSIGDDGVWDALKLVAMLAKYAGYSGLLVELDECVNLYKINNTTSRDRNYEQILRIFNECLQGDAEYIGVVFAGTPEFVMDPRRGLFSYDALKSRLMSSDYAKRAGDIVDTSGPVIELKPLSQEDLLVLLGNIVNVEALGNKDDWLMTNDDMETYLRKQYETLGADYYKTPRELLRGFVMLLRTLREHPDMSARDAIGSCDVKADKKASGLGAALDSAKPNNSVIDSLDDDEDFGF